MTETTRDEKILKARGLAGELIVVLDSAKSTERTRQDRNIAIAITEAEKLLAWLVYWCQP